MQRKAGFYWLRWCGGPDEPFVAEYEPRNEHWGKHFDAVGLWKLTGTEDTYYVDPDGESRNPRGSVEFEVLAGPIEPPAKRGC